MFDIVLSVDFIQKTYQFVSEIQSVNNVSKNNAIMCFKFFMVLFIGHSERSEVYNYILRFTQDDNLNSKFLNYFTDFFI